ncbi:hypothetical protein U1Q18_050313, partial [Sarracenia purpurea var. burkii]
ECDGDDAAVLHTILVVRHREIQEYTKSKPQPKRTNLVVFSIWTLEGRRHHVPCCVISSYYQHSTDSLMRCCSLRVVPIVYVFLSVYGGFESV